MSLATLVDQHVTLSRRYFLALGAAGVAALKQYPLLAGPPISNETLTKAIADLQAKFVTPQDDFGTVERGNPLPYTLPPDRLREAGLTRETWRLEVVADPDSNAVLENPLTLESGGALDFDGLLKIGQSQAVRYFKVMTCNNGNSPLGHGLWEGVPLRDVVWRAKPKENIRHLFYYGYHNDDPKQMFQCWLPINRVLEDPPGEFPVMLCYKLNGDWISGKRGGPVRMLVPEAYGFKSVKWLKRVVLTNNHQANDTYANGNNDINSWLKTMARFAVVPSKVKPMAPIAVTGIAQVGISGLRKVQVWLQPQDVPWPADDPHFSSAPWRDAEILPVPSSWPVLPGEKLPEIPLQFDAVTGNPHGWPMRNALAHWAMLMPGAAAGKYDLRCRTIDARGQAQPLPRPFAKSGRNAIQRLPLLVEA